LSWQKRHSSEPSRCWTVSILEGPARCLLCCFSHFHLKSMGTMDPVNRVLAHFLASSSATSYPGHLSVPMSAWLSVDVTITSVSVCLMIRCFLKPKFTSVQTADGSLTSQSTSLTCQIWSWNTPGMLPSSYTIVWEDLFDFSWNSPPSGY
jgi:hypothetical protein